MQLIGRGWQYSVYDLGHGRVSKRYNSFPRSYWEMLKEQLLHLWPPVSGFKKIYYQNQLLAARSLKNIINSPLDQGLFGHPQLITDLDFQQDYITPLSEYFKHHSLSESRVKIDDFVRLCLRLHHHSLIEKHFNMAGNFGLNNSGEIVLLDLGEICSDPQEISGQITNRVWALPDVLSKFPSSLHKYFVSKMDEAFI